ncbi:MAG: homoserine dehydrogenase [Clostridiales bacterium]|mgnify:FL=1|nr:homoserine dehydrogenase [Clostridiales bacterium]
MYVAVMGYGTVGSGVVEILSKNHDSIIKKSAQNDIQIKYILDRNEFPNDPNADKFIKDFNIILNDDDVKVVVETMGGVTPAFDFALACLNKGKSVVTSNKELVATKGLELLDAAKRNNANFLFEASVGGGIPIIRPISQCLAANEIEEISGILNGTTNFILGKMINDNMSFEDALKLAQDNGYAEKDPTADIEGFDACRKICILAALCFGKHVYPESIHTEGITKITLADIAYAQSFGSVVKLIANAKKLDNGKIYAIVSPAIVNKSSQLAGVDDVFNAVLIKGDATGDVVFYGKGAGKLPTASAVVADVIDCSNNLERRKDFGWDDYVEDYVIDHLDKELSLYVRAKTNDTGSALASIHNTFDKATILNRCDAPQDEIAFVTPIETERTLRQKLDSINDITPLSVIRVCDC